MTGYTKGPWAFTVHESTGDCGLHADGTGIFIEAFADIRHAGESARDEAQANARLISAAPEMYEALKAIRELSGLDHWISGASAAVMSRMADIHQHSDAALAKAEGKA